MDKLYSEDKKEFNIIKKGIKYYHIKALNSYQEYKVDINTLMFMYKVYGQRNKQFFKSIKEIEEINYLNELKGQIKNLFSNWKFPDLSKKQCEDILNIINNKP